MEAIPIALPADLFVPAESRHYEGSVALDRLEAGVDLYEFDSPLEWSVDISNTGDAFLVTGMAQARAHTACARCLEPVAVSLIGDVEGFFLMSDQEAPDDLDADEYEILNADHIIDLAPLIEAALLLEVPLVPLCSPDCKGLCAGCGKNLNEGPCDCPSEASELQGENNPFSVLKDFDFEQ